MGLLDELKAEEPPPKHLCSVAKVLDAMSKQDAEDLLAAMSDGNIMATSIARVLQRHGHDLKPEAVRRHRKRECRCAF